MNTLDLFLILFQNAVFDLLCSADRREGNPVMDACVQCLNSGVAAEDLAEVLAGVGRDLQMASTHLRNGDFKITGSGQLELSV